MAMIFDLARTHRSDCVTIDDSDAYGFGKDKAEITTLTVPSSYSHLFLAQLVTFSITLMGPNVLAIWYVNKCLQQRLRSSRKWTGELHKVLPACTESSEPQRVLR